jgi:sugar-specific transcriptional regulator TrmB
MKNYQWILAKLGIPEKAVKLYVDLLDHGRSSPSEIVARTGLHRPEVYRYIPFLADKWLVVNSKTGKRQFFTAWSPERIAELLSELEQNANYVISELNEKYIVMNQKPHVEYREGRKGVTAVFADIVSTLEDDETFYRVTSEVDVEKVNTYLPANYRTVRDKKKLQRYVIMSANAAKVKQKRLDRDLVVMPPSMDDFRDNILMTIYGHKVAYIDFNTETAITIANPMIAEFQKKLFKLAYNSLKNTK